MSAKKIKVLHVIKTLSLGGAETNLYNLVLSTDPERFEVHVAYSFGGEIEERFKARGIRLFKYASASHKIKSPATLWIVLRLAWYILKNDIGIVHTHIFNAHVWASLAAKLTRRKIIEHVHDFRYMDRREFQRRRGFNNQYRFVRLLKDWPDAVIVLTEANREFISRNACHPQDRIRSIQNGIPIAGGGSGPQFDPCALRKKYGIPEKSIVALTSARISAEKNLDLILRIAPRIAEQVPEIVFLVAGSGPLLEDLQALAKSMNMEGRLRFLGFRESVLELLAVSDLFLLPSLLELHSISVLEAMSMKIPILISKNVGCHDEFIESWQNGILLDPFEDEAWVQAVVRLSKNRELRLEIGRRGYETCIEKFNVKNIAKKIEDVYHELVPA